MRLLVQRVTEASVEVEGKVVGEIGPGALVFFAAHKDDSLESAKQLAHKLSHFRFFTDDQGKMNLNILQAGGQALVVSQFTLYANCDNGRRPEFTESAPPKLAIPLYEKFVEELSSHLGKPVPTGVFGASMKVSLINAGPVTFLLER